MQIDKERGDVAEARGEVAEAGDQEEEEVAGG